MRVFLTICFDYVLLPRDELYLPDQSSLSGIDQFGGGLIEWIGDLRVEAALKWRLG